MAARTLGVALLVPDLGCTAVFPRVWDVFIVVVTEARRRGTQA